MSAPESRPYDLVLFGATGYTGRLTAIYLACARPKSLRWALAGRDRAKLESIRKELATIDESLGNLRILIADSADEASLRTMVASTRVVCSTVGPYAKYGHGLVTSAAEAGTHYCDLTGETTFVRQTIDRCHATAEKNSARIVPCCGFDSVPSDLGVFELAQSFASEGATLAQATLHVESLRGGASGGTLASMFTLLEEASHDKATAKLLRDPYALMPDRERDRGPDGPDLASVRFDDTSGRWMAPFVMAAINTRVVRRSNALLGFQYGRDFRYAEVTSFPKGAAGLSKALGLTLGLGAIVGLASTSLGRRALGAWLPSPGEGPSAHERDRGYFRVRIRGTSAPRSDGSVLKRSSVVIGHSDPGYGETAKMLGESALSLAFDELPQRYGVLTPASCFGSALVERLRRAGMEFRIEA
jgi:hypothetical protein